MTVSDCPHYITLATGVYFRCNQTVEGHGEEHTAVVNSAEDSNTDLTYASGRIKPAIVQLRWTVDENYKSPKTSWTDEEREVRRGEAYAESIVYGDINGNY